MEKLVKENSVITDKIANETGLARLEKIIARLMEPRKGCVWDRAQTINSLAPYTLEEAYEVVDAIERQDMDDLRQELGDLLYQVVFSAYLAEKQNYFNFDDVCHAICDKLVRRHPHIFAVEQQPHNWEAIKKQERLQKGQNSLMDDIALNLPALKRATKIQSRWQQVGFDWLTIEPVLDKVQEEISEVIHEVNQPQVNPLRVEEELGDLLFAVVNLSRHLGLDAEQALTRANIKLEKRFRLIEQHLAKQNKKLSNVSLEEMDAAWNQIKEEEKEKAV